MRLLFLILLGWIVTYIPLKCQDVLFNQTIEFTIADGLPSNECHDILQDSLGYIWVATDRGLVRYDGYEFKVYGVSEGLKDISCLSIFLDQNNDIWINTLSKKLYKYVSSLDKIIPYQYNFEISPYTGRTAFISEIYVDKNNTLFLSGSAIISFDINGKATYYNTTNPYSGYHLLEIENDFIFSNHSQDEFSVEKPDPEDYILLNNGIYEPMAKLYYKGLLYPIPINLEWNRNRGQKAYRLKSDKLLLSSHGSYYTINDTLRHIRNGTFINDLLKLEGGGFITAQMDKIGVKHYESFDDFIVSNGRAILEDVSASRLKFDTDGNLWICTLEDGLIFLKNTEISSRVTTTRSIENKISDIEISKDGKLYFVEEDKKLCSFDLNTDEYINLEISRDEILDLFFEYQTATLFKGALKTKVYNHSKVTDKRYLFRNTDELSHNLENTISKQIDKIDSSSLVSIGPKWFTVYDIFSLEEIYNSEFESPNRKLRVNTVARYQKEAYLVGTVQGLYSLQGSTYRCLDSLFSVFSTRINKIIRLGDNYYIGTQGAGLLIWNGSESLKQIDKKNGLISDVVENITINGNGQIYVSSYSGLSVLYPIVDKLDYSIRNFTTADGLPSNDVYDTEYYQDTLYIASGGGLGKLQLNKLENVKSRSPHIESIMISDSIYYTVESIKKLKHHENDISISFKTIDLLSNGDIEYRYRFNSDKWKQTKQNKLSFLSLSPGEYILEIQSKNKDNIWSISQIAEFEISPPWWKVWWFQCIATVFMISLIFLFYRRRISSLKQELKIQEDVKDLERQALQAQMNPHFIFNCLNSIQNFIMSNDKENAMSYLSKFARLIRQNLEASTETTISLNLEMEMLRNYLELEKMRFRRGFKYELLTENIVDTKEIRIPPLLIQPFVENAILHGIKNKKGRGLIKISFSRMKDNLHVEVVDNGEGISVGKPKVNRKSYGVGITEKRLAHINNYKGEQYKIDITSTKRGTRVRIIIKL